MKAILGSKLARGVVDWVDLQWSILIEQIKTVAPRAHGRLLDVGCGDKAYEPFFRPFVSSYIGIEYASTFGKTAAAALGRADVVYSGPTMPFRDGVFDTVLSVQVLEHTPAPGPLVKEMARVLAPDGLLILTAPFSFRVHEHPHDYFRYTHYGLRHLCEEAGLEIVETLSIGGLWSVLGHKLNTYLAFRIARAQGTIQGMGKLGYDAPTETGARWWTLPFVAPAMLGSAAAARILDRVLAEPDESLGFMILARHRGR
jgi:SAM-dependent methyltransferase